MHYSLLFGSTVIHENCSHNVGYFYYKGVSNKNIMPSEIALSSTEVPKPERLGEGKRKRGRLGSWSLPMLAPLCPVFSLPSLSKSGQRKSCQVSGRFLELPPLSWKSRPAGEARRIPINISVGWTALPADAKTQRALEGFGQHS